MVRFGLLIASIAVWCSPAYGQGFSSTVSGRLLEFEHFRPQVIGSHPQNWAVVQDEAGLIYVGNNAGVLVFDGTQWRLRRTGNNSIVRSLAVDSSGTVFVGAKGEIGYLAPSTDGSVEYVSLVSSVPELERDFADVWTTTVIKGRVHFVTPSKVLIWDRNAMTVVRSDSKFHTAFRVDDRLIVREVGVGLVEISATGTKSLLHGGERFEDTRVYAVTAFGRSGNWLIATRNDGLFEYDGLSVNSFVSDADSVLASAGVYHGVTLSSGRVALATLGAGVIILNADGSVHRSIGSAYGLPDLVVNHLYVDRDEGLWIVLNSGGVARVDLASPVSMFDRRDGLEGVVYGVAAMPNSLFVVTGSGLYRSLPSKSGRGSEVLEFEEIPYLDLPFGISVAGDALIVLTQEGIEVFEGESVQRFEIAKSHAVHAMGRDSLLVGHANGLTLLERKNGGRWRSEPLEISVGDVRDIGSADSADKVVVVTRDASVSIVEVRHSGRVRSVPYATPKISGEGADLAQAYGDVVIVSPNVYRSIPSNNGVGSEMILDSVLTSTDWKNPIVTVGEDNAGRPWVVYKNDVCILDALLGSCTRVGSLSFPRETIGNIYFDNDIAWISSGNTLFRFDPALDRDLVPSFAPLVRRVSLIGSDSTLFYGHESKNAQKRSLSYADNDVQFNFSAPIYYGQDQIRYQYTLSGRETEWSEWTDATIAEYTNLREGNYSFRVKAKNIYGFDSPIGSFSFTIIPPWYRTWWAYLMYVSGCAVVAGLSLRYYRMAVAHRRAEEQAKELAAEKLVTERLQHANERLKVANNRLVEVNALKDEFLATTSHELRTPITAIQGYAAILREELGGPHKEFAEIIDKSSLRLMRTLNSVLDLAKLRSGTIEMNPAVLDLNDFVSRTVESCDEMAATKQLALVVNPSDVGVFVECDQYLLRNAILNILDNAIKFSEAGIVSVTVQSQSGRALVQITDQGIGIDRSFLPHIFDDFKQESDGLAREHGGTGLGLAIASLMVSAMGGEIKIESEKGVGTTATLLLPLAAFYESAVDPIQTDSSRHQGHTRANDRNPVESPIVDRPNHTSLSSDQPATKKVP